MAVDKPYFIDLFAARGLSLRKVAGELNLWPATLTQALNDKREMKMVEVVKLAKILSVPIVEVVAHLGYDEVVTDRHCSVIGHITGDFSVEKVPEGVIERVPIPWDVDNNVEAIQAHTSDTPAAFCDGWVAYITGKQDPQDLIGAYCVVEAEGGEWWSGTLRRGYQPDSFNIATAGGTGPKNVRLNWARKALLTAH